MRGLMRAAVPGVVNSGEQGARAWPCVVRSDLQGGECLWVGPYESPPKVKNPNRQLHGVRQ
jgi:hypothetical protein